MADLISKKIAKTGTRIVFIPKPARKVIIDAIKVKKGIIKYSID